MTTINPNNSVPYLNKLNVTLSSTQKTTHCANFFGLDVRFAIMGACCAGLASRIPSLFSSTQSSTALDKTTNISKSAATESFLLNSKIANVTIILETCSIFQKPSSDFVTDQQTCSIKEMSNPSIRMPNLEEISNSQFVQKSPISQTNNFVTLTETLFDAKLTSTSPSQESTNVAWKIVNGLYELPWYFKILGAYTLKRINKVANIAYKNYQDRLKNKNFHLDSELTYWIRYEATYPLKKGVIINAKHRHAYRELIKAEKEYTQIRQAVQDAALNDQVADTVSTRKKVSTLRLKVIKNTEFLRTELIDDRRDQAAKEKHKHFVEELQSLYSSSFHKDSQVTLYSTHQRYNEIKDKMSVNSDFFISKEEFLKQIEKEKEKFARLLKYYFGDGYHEELTQMPDDNDLKITYQNLMSSIEKLQSGTTFTQNTLNRAFKVWNGWHKTLIEQSKFYKGSASKVR